MVAPRSLAGLSVLAAALAFGVLVLADEAEATHYRGGTLQPQVDVTGLLGRVTLTGTLTYDSGFFQNAPLGSCLAGETIAWGDGTLSGSYLRVVALDATRNLLTAELRDVACSAPLSHHYSVAGAYTITLQACCRESDQVNNPNRGFRLEASVDTTVANSAPDLEGWVQANHATASCKRWSQCVVQIPATDADGDPLTARASLPCEAEPSCTYQPPGPPWADHTPAVYGSAGGGAAFVWNTWNATPGTYSFQIQVSDGKSEVPLDMQIVVDANERPVAQFTWDGTPQAGKTTKFRDASSDPDGTVATWYWHVQGPDAYAWGTGRDFAYHFEAPGTYTVRLRVTDDDGAPSDFAARTIDVLPANSAPAAAFTATGHGTTWTFVDASTDAEGSVVSWHWDFGDGAEATTRNATHAYRPGTYTVVLTVTDAHGATASVSRDVRAPCQQSCTA